uniref:Translation initiation factor IF- 2 domain-containing protein n=1 Tax=Acrobeloides nanus TaxID=290746 RepID=A0A914EAD7_9BILA
MPIVPISAYHGDGIGNLISCILEYSQTCLSQKLAIPQELDCTILEVRDMPGFRTSIDVVIKNGILKKNDTIVLMGKDGVMSHSDEDIDQLKKKAEEQLKIAVMSLTKNTIGVYVQASHFNALETALECLKKENIPYSGVNTGPVQKEDAEKSAEMLKLEPKFACILAYGVTVDQEVQQFADLKGVKIFQSENIFDLMESFLKS